MKRFARRAAAALLAAGSMASAAPAVAQQQPAARNILYRVDGPSGATVSCCSSPGGLCFAKDGVAVVCDNVPRQCPIPTPAGCTINGVNYEAGAVHPSNPCLVCDPNQSTTAWSNNDNFVNNNGFCWQDSGLCSSGFCKGLSCLENGDCGGHCIDGQRVCGI